MLIVAIISVVLTIAALIYAFKTQESGNMLFAGVAAVVALLLGVWSGYLALMPEYRLYRAQIEKRILVEQAKAEADAAVEEARAEVSRARGTAEANNIVANSITEPYLRYLYINNLKNTSNQVIYLPTEAGLPILEAKRLE